MKKAIYAGSFDPPTSGHYDIICKARSLFDTLHVVVATNANKQSLFSVDDRKKMLFDMCANFSNIVITELPSNRYLVDYAQEVGASFVVRGIRDPKDFMYELEMYKINKRLSNKIETIYLMPSPCSDFVSSSLVKSLIGIMGWRNKLKSSNFVNDTTLNYLVNHFAKDRFYKLYDNLSVIADSLCIPSASAMWDTISKAYLEPWRKYHNLNHILDCLELFDSVDTSKVSACERVVVEFSIFMHDFVLDNEERSAHKAQCLLCTRHPDIADLILATKHSALLETNKHICQLISDIDLSILGSDRRAYNEYCHNIYDEYYEVHKKDNAGKEIAWSDFRKVFIPARINFIKHMLEKQRIFFTEDMYNKFEVNARNNLGYELETNRRRNWVD